MPAPSSQVPAPPPPPTIPGVTVVTTGTLSPGDLAALRLRASELSSQLKSATGRRASVQQSLRNATGADRAGLEQRLGVLDTRIARLESDIDENGTQLASLAANRASSLQPPFAGFNNFPRSRGMSYNLVPVAIVFTLFVLSPLALSISRMFWRRGSMPRQVLPPVENAERLARMEQAIDSIAIEIERVSEGQRFVTRLMSERQPAPLGAGQQPAGVPDAGKVAVPR
ncbi:hypothetical protein BH11GEM1_BH11GEM1_17710 [soil metagenome]